MVAITSHHSNLSRLLIAPQFHRIAGKGKDLSIKLLDGGSGSALGRSKRAVFFSFLGSYIDALIRSTKVEGFVRHHPKGPLQIVACSSCFGWCIFFWGGHLAQVLGNSEDWRRILGKPVSSFEPSVLENGWNWCLFCLWNLFWCGEWKSQFDYISLHCFVIMLFGHYFCVASKGNNLEKRPLNWFWI